MVTVKPVWLVIACTLLIGGAVLIAQAPATTSAAPAAPACPTIHSMTKTVQFCGWKTDCRDGHQYPEVITIVPDPDPTVQVIGVWTLPVGAPATLGISEYHAIGTPDATNANAAVIRFMHPGSAQFTVFDYTVIIKYMKRQ